MRINAIQKQTSFGGSKAAKLAEAAVKKGAEQAQRASKPIRTAAEDATGRILRANLDTSAWARIQAGNWGIS